MLEEPKKRDGSTEFCMRTDNSRWFRMQEQADQIDLREKFRFTVCTCSLFTGFDCTVQDPAPLTGTARTPSCDRLSPTRDQSSEAECYDARLRTPQ